MQSALRPPGGEKTWSAMALLLGGAVSLVLAAKGNDHPATTAFTGIWFILAGVGVWRNRLWGYWLGLLATAIIAGKLALALTSEPFQWSRLIYCLSFAWFTVALYMERPRSGKSKEPLISLVLLLGEPRSMTAYSLAQQVSEAWGVPVETAKEKDASKDENVAAKTYVMGDTPLFMIGHQGGFFLVNNFHRPYFDNPEKSAEECPELRLQKVIKEHQAWLSVDLLHIGQSPDRTEAYRQIARLVAELAGDDCLAVYCPENGHLNLFDSSLIAGLRGENPLEVFQQITQLPVIQVSDEDPEMQAAVAEARRRWPEFVAAFTNRQPDHHFAVKAPITQNENTEFIWISVKSIDDTTIYGCLDNDPVNLGKLKSGDAVTVPLKDLNDWVVMRGEDLSGMFTSKILINKQRKE